MRLPTLTAVEYGGELKYKYSIINCDDKILVLFKIIDTSDTDNIKELLRMTEFASSHIFGIQKQICLIPIEDIKKQLKNVKSETDIVELYDMASEGFVTVNVTSLSKRKKHEIQSN